MSGAPLPRGTVTFLFSDIEESTELVRRVGGETFAEVRTQHRQLLREAFDAHSGREVDTAGDGFFVAFESARDAVAAAVEGQRALAGSSWPAQAELHVRMGLHTAEPYLADDGYVGVGVHRAARLCDAARGGQIIVSNATAGIIEDLELPGVELVDLGDHALKGLHAKQRLFQIRASGLRSEFGPPRTSAGDPKSRGTGTFIYSDLSGWRQVIRVLGDEASAALITEYQARVAGAVEANEGTIVDSGGDHALAVFGNASDAVRAACVIRDSLADLAWPPQCNVAVSIAVHSGRWSGDPRNPTAGSAIYRLFRTATTADPGQILVSQTTATLLEGDAQAPTLNSLGERTIPDFDEPAHVYEVIAQP